MERKEINISEAYKKLFSSYEILPSENHWNSVRKKVALKQFFTFSLNSFNIFYAALVPVALVLTMVYISKIPIIGENKTSFDQKIIFIQEPVKENPIPEIKPEKQVKSSKQLLISDCKKDSISNTNTDADKIIISADTVKSAPDLKTDSILLCQKQIKKEKRVRIIHNTVEKRDTVFEIKQRDELSEKDIFTKKKSRKR